jgi:hypothetical protein
MDLGQSSYALIYTNEMPFEPTMTPAVQSESQNTSLGQAETASLGVTTVVVNQPNHILNEETNQIAQVKIQLHLNSFQVAAAQALGILGPAPKITLEDIDARSNQHLCQSLCDFTAAVVFYQDYHPAV